MIKLSIKNYWPFFLGLFLGIYFISLNVLGKTLLYLPGDLGDTRFVIYLLEHFYQYITGNVDYYWGAPFFVPAPDVLTFSENLLGVAPLFAMFRKLGFDVETSFQFWYLLLVVLNYSSSYVFLNKLFNNKYAAVIGAMLFAFSMALQGQLEHAQTFPRFCIPLALLFATEFIQTFKARYFFLMCSTLVIQMYCTIYLGMMLIIPLLIFLAISLLSHYKDYLKHVTDIKWLGYVLLGLAVNGAALYYLLKPYTQRADRTGYTPWEIVHDNVPRLESYFFSRPGSFLWSAFENTADYLPRFYNQYLFIGGLGILLCTVFILFAIKKIIDNRNSIQSFIQKPIVLLGLTALCTYLLYLRVGDFTLYKGVFSLPGYGSIRAVPRIINIELMFVAIAAAYVLAWFFSSIKKYAALAFVL
ncbi:MAG: hypothetical protein HKO56_09195, partial [Bacteroidia bacterium]|nr:hypothetical protein [Bacteroidia bacterium]NNM16821.1 hypothetical protein [Bacteroidia bacterium]